MPEESLVFPGLWVSHKHSPLLFSWKLRKKNNYFARDVPIRGVGGVVPLIFSNLQESQSKVCHAARELTTAFSVTSCF